MNEVNDGYETSDGVDRCFSKFEAVVASGHSLSWRVVDTAVLPGGASREREWTAEKQKQREEREGPTRHVWLD